MAELATQDVGRKRDWWRRRRQGRLPQAQTLLHVLKQNRHRTPWHPERERNLRGFFPESAICGNMESNEDKYRCVVRKTHLSFLPLKTDVNCSLANAVKTERAGTSCANFEDFILVKKASGVTCSDKLCRFSLLNM